MFKVSINGHNEFFGLNRDSFEEGEEVRFFVPMVRDADTQVFAENVRLKSTVDERERLIYSFIMPAHDVEIEVKVSASNMCRRVWTSTTNNGPVMGIMGTMGMASLMAQFNGQQLSTQQPLKSGETKFCPECGAVIAKTAKFCSECGALQP